MDIPLQKTFRKSHHFQSNIYIQNSMNYSLLLGEKNHNVRKRLKLYKKKLTGLIKYNIQINGWIFTSEDQWVGNRSVI